MPEMSRVVFKEGTTEGRASWWARVYVDDTSYAQGILREFFASDKEAMVALLKPLVEAMERDA